MEGRAAMTADYVPALLTDEVEEDLRASIRDLLARRITTDQLIGAYDGAPQPDLWPELSGLGLPGLLIGDDHGGAGATPAVAAVVLEELGAVPARTPMLTSAVIATTVLTQCGDTALLPGLADGSAVAALTVPFSADPYSVVATVAATAGRLTGRVMSVAGAESATVLLVPGSDGALYAVDAADATITPVASLDMTRPVSDVVFAGVTGRQVSADGAAAIRAGLALGAALLASEQAGVARWCVTETVSYLKERRQFGRVVGGFQAVKHRLAELYADTEQASAVARAAAVTITDRGVDDDESALMTAVAAAYCGDHAVRAAEEAVQLHGGIGMTWEHPAHLYLKRAKADQLALGSPSRHRTALTILADLPA
ncbi:acyl-CoA dehydrogenase family protein [Gordonia neofelifaecis]|uniref:Acyl-CoA dehydrogenase domain protein n=1 Tax=Gordonia neofelifaecis NRRL B-59395 TaxID=644548 RepID=F1YMP8_9ACTN|nr:acyl-CoA dehydrogenase family protein [Gordonia neofelifaecis]EGD53983.1 acyl-CoA dehydrogenase domain protein [Gordonia neofelifaecis NRRL B-59395]